MDPRLSDLTPTDPVPTVSVKRLGDAVVAPAGVAGDGLAGAGADVGDANDGVGVYAIGPVSDVVSHSLSLMFGIFFRLKF